MTKSNKILLYSGIAIVVLIIFAVVGKSQGWIGGGEATNVTTEEAKKRTIIETVSASGKIFPEIEVKISPDVSGEIVEVYVQEGDSVKRGDILVKIKPDIYSSNVDRAMAALNQAKANLANSRAQAAQVQARLEEAEMSFERNKKLYEQKVISKSEFEAAQTAYKSTKAQMEAANQSVEASRYNVKSAEASLKEAHDNLQKTTIYAPMDGIVSMMNVEVGERVVGTTQMAGTEIMRIANMGSLEARVEVGENDILKVSIGDIAKIEVDAYIDREFRGMVTEIANSANSDMINAEQVTNFEVKIRLFRETYEDLLNKDRKGHYPFRPGMSASVEIETEKEENVLSVPIQSVTTRKPKKGLFRKKDKKEKDEEEKKEEIKEIIFVYLPKKQKVESREVTTGIQDDNYIRVLTGVEPGEEVVTGPYSAISRKLEDGDKVKKVENLYGQTDND